MLGGQTISIIKSTVPILQQHGVTITSTFYKNLFEAHPSLLNIFNHTNQTAGKQQGALANTLLAAALNIEKLNSLDLSGIVHKHCALGVLPEHYPIVGQHLIGAMKQVLGDGCTPEVVNAWTEAYGVISQAFIDAEANLYKATEEIVGGWDSKKSREFIVDKKVEESSNITSFYLKPSDGKAIATYLPGQYLTVKITICANTHIRHYSLSDSPSTEYYRISVKKEECPTGVNPNGVVSTYLHSNVNKGDTILVSPPFGNFILNDLTKESNILLVSGGVGITPLLSMVKEISNKQPNRKVHFIYSTKNIDHQPFKQELNTLKTSSSNVKVDIVHSELHGHITVADIQKFTTTSSTPDEIKSTLVFLVGPVGFMSTVNKYLLELGYSKDNIHYEVFGPLTSI